jgi:hypothetical protein
MPSLTELNDVWVLRDGKMVAEGDAKVIDELLENELVEVKKGNWAFLYRHKDTGELWDLVYREARCIMGVQDACVGLITMIPKRGIRTRFDPFSDYAAEKREVN